MFTSFVILLILGFSSVNANHDISSIVPPTSFRYLPQSRQVYSYQPNTGINEFRLIEFSWRTNITNIVFCLENNGYNVLPELYLTVFDVFNSILISPLQQGATGLKLSWSYPIQCETTKTHTVYGELINRLVFGPSENGASGVTKRRFENGTIDNPRITLTGGDITIDVRVLQAASIFYNVLIHEVGHVLGLEHTISPDTVMGNRIRGTINHEVWQEDDYLLLKTGDVNGIRAILTRDKPGFTPPFITKQTYEFTPLYPADQHVSGTSKFVMRDKIYRYNNKNNNINDFWIPILENLELMNNNNILYTEEPTPHNKPIRFQNGNKRRRKRRRKPTVKPPTSLTPTITDEYYDYYDYLKYGDVNVEIVNDLDNLIDIDSYNKNNTVLEIETNVIPEVTIGEGGNGDIDISLNTNVNPYIHIRGDRNVIVRIHTNASPDIYIND
jgi:hypothetical protein